MKRVSWIVVPLIAASLLTFACGKKKGGSSDSSGEPAADGGNTSSSTDTDTGTGTVKVGDVGIALAVPQDLVVASPFNAETAELALAASEQAKTYLPGQVAASSLTEGADAAPKGPAENRARLAKFLYEASDVAGCMYEAAPPPAVANVDCYGPSVEYENNPDLPTPPSGGPKTYAAGEGVYGSGDLGVVKETAGDGSACISAKMNDQIAKTSAAVDRVIGTTGMLVCLARLAGKALPAVGASLDLNSEHVPAVTEAKIERLADQDGHPVYFTSFTVTQTGNGNGPNDKPRIRHVGLKHIPLDESNATYNGKLWIASALVTPSGATDCGQYQKENAKRATSIVYNKTSATSLKFELRDGAFMDSVADDDMFDDKYHAKAPTTCNLGAEYALFDLNPEVGTGKVSYSWIAGQAGENARSFVATVDIKDEKKQGCGHYSFGKSLNDIYSERESAKAGDKLTGMIDKFICNWAHPATVNLPEPAPQAIVQRQCMTQNEAGLFIATSNNIKFSPQAACETGDANSTFKYWAQNTPDTKYNAPATHELLPIVAAYGSGQSSTNAVLSSELESPAIPVDVD